NDNDGSPDSIWVDLGMPVTTDAAGRMVKPLFAIMVVDLDGRVNLNAHGTFQSVLTALPDLANVTTGPATSAPVWNGNNGIRPRPVSTYTNLYPGSTFVSEERNTLGAYAYGTAVAGTGF